MVLKDFQFGSKEFLQDETRVWEDPDKRVAGCLWPINEINPKSWNIPFGVKIHPAVLDRAD